MLSMGKALLLIRRWFQPSVQSADFDAVAGSRYQIDAAAGVITVTLPASPSIGDEIEFSDATASWATHNITINRNGQKINSGTSDFTGSTASSKLSCVFISTAYGWSIK